jgi:hypothetical protein
MSLLQTFPQNFEFKRFTSALFWSALKKRVIDKIEVKMLGKYKNGTTLTAINKNLEILAQTRSYVSILIFIFCTFLRITSEPDEIE